MSNISKRKIKLEEAAETVKKERGEKRAPRLGRRDLLRMGLLTGAGLLMPKLSLGAASQTRASLLDRTTQLFPASPLFQTGRGTEVVRRSRLGNNTEDITFIPSLLRGGVAIMDGYDVLAFLSFRLIKLFDVLSLKIKAAPRGIAFVENQNLFAFSDTAQPTLLFVTDIQGRPRKTINIQYLNGDAPVAVEGLAYLPVQSTQFPDHFVLVAAFPVENGIESRLEVINLSGQVVREIVPQSGLASVFLTGVCFRSPGTLLVSSDDDEIIYELDFDGNVIASYNGAAPSTPPTLRGIEGLVQTPDGLIAAAGGFDGIIAELDPGTDLPLRPFLDYRIGPGLSLPSGIAWDSTANQFLIIALDRNRDLEPFISTVTPNLAAASPLVQLDNLTRKLTYLPDKQLIAATHTNNPRGILLFNKQGQSVGQIDTSQLGIPQVISYIPATSEYVLVFRDPADPSKSSKLFLLNKRGGLSNMIDLAPAGVTRITAATFFNPADPSGGQFLVVDGPTNAAFVVDMTGATLNKFSIRDALGILAPTAVTAITTSGDGDAFAITNGETSEVIVFRL